MSQWETKPGLDQGIGQSGKMKWGLTSQLDITTHCDTQQHAINTSQARLAAAMIGCQCCSKHKQQAASTWCRCKQQNHLEGQKAQDKTALFHSRYRMPSRLVTSPDACCQPYRYKQPWSESCPATKTPGCHILVCDEIFSQPHSLRPRLSQHSPLPLLKQRFMELGQMLAYLYNVPW